LGAAGYLLWQTLFFVKTEVLDRKFLDEHADYLTSLRCLASDHKNGMNKLVLSATRRIGVVGKTEFFDPSTAKTKLIFMMSQLIYTALIMLLMPVIYSNYIVTTLCVIFIAWSGIYNGSSYYIDVFSQRYNLQFEKSASASACTAASTASAELSTAASTASAELCGASSEEEKLKAS
jgi:hypothetical protein